MSTDMSQVRIPIILPYLLITSSLDLYEQTRAIPIFRHNQKAYLKVLSKILRLKFLQNWRENDLILNFLNFWVPGNRCFEINAVHSFLRWLLKRELSKTHMNLNTAKEVDVARSPLKENIAENLLPTVSSHVRLVGSVQATALMRRHEKKIN